MSQWPGARRLACEDGSGRPDIQSSSPVGHNAATLCNRGERMSFVRDLKFAVQSLARTPGLACAVIFTLALGIGANAAIFSLVRSVLLRPLVNRDENRLIYIRQSAPGFGAENDNFSVPEIQDLRASVKSVSEFGDI